MATPITLHYGKERGYGIKEKMIHSHSISPHISQQLVIIIMLLLLPFKMQIEKKY
jgi:hypothetical protein